ncbi:MAG: pseudaminic acid synthase [Alphaproteobacteria bacterium]|nr:pseudaminic acid synthase [Alphaproteobacteria bacterium]MBU0797926.1 pseudaminic acid synthase [Alphaproteobacteria bacterium]MBU0886122.1 pseudaminic acid synthase [Alphaproteobacteria bacterium]MBU1812762.1 pseudaminic acid synthase [Alphaproteobacteria bacterium]
MHIAGRPIGPEHPPYVIAEMSGNHNGDITRAFALIDAAAAAGADAVKLQTYTADTITLDHDGPEFLIKGGLWDGRRLHALYQEAQTPWDWHAPLFARAREAGIVIFSSPFDPTAIDLLEGLDAPAYKIASFEIVDLPLIRLAAATGKPLIISTGMATLAEMQEAVAAAREAGATQIVLLHCVSGYPTPPGESNLLTIPDMAARFDVPIGLSDHTMGTAVASAAVALGAVLIEKHFTLRRADGGPDSAFSLEPDELAELVRNCRIAWEARGAIDYDLNPSEAGARMHRRSLYAVADIAAGEILTAASIRSIRPGLGLAPKHLDAVLGRRALHPIPRGTPLDWDMVE